MQTKFKHPMMAVAKDSISGFEGVIIARTAHLFGCAQYGLAPQELASDGTPKKTEYFDEARIEILDATNAVYGDDEYADIFAVPLGTEVKDKVSGFEGKVLMTVEYLHNCSQYYVEPPVDKDGKPREGQFYDEGRLAVIGEGIAPEEVAVPKRGSLFTRDQPTR
ncbi:hypothetical protein [Paenibacillus medicaginis]|uniref:Uncharacterized protein n=1 Tax=Paenibacillus medicaginis TaxID=1470560 RepID=A0ABV5BUS7_9BACL